MNKEIKISGRKIFYRVFGKGKPVMLVHGFGETGTVWNSQVDFFKTKIKLIIPDLPGSGQSEMINDMSMEGMAGVIKKIADNENVNPFIFIGHSMGGYIMLAFAEKYPEYLSSFGLFHSTAFADSKEKKATRRKGIEFIKKHGAFEFLKSVTPNLFSPETKSGNQQLIEDFIKSLNNFSPDALVSYYEAMINRPERTEILKRSENPVLFVMGMHDVAVPTEDGLKLCHLPEKSYIDILKKSGHMGMMEEPVKCNKILEEFIL